MGKLQVHRYVVIMSVYLLWTAFGSCTYTGEMGELFPAHSEIRRRDESFW